jgi:hypothetical protein
MPVILTIEIKKSGASFSNVTEALDQFGADHADTFDSTSRLDTINEALEAAKASGDLVIEFDINSTNDGFIKTETWTDSGWESIMDQLTTYATLKPEWSRTVTQS